jgi:DNA polymerase-3 subunit gamma/tau
MPYQVLARKYRPQRFSDVAGQEHVTRTLLNALAQQRIAHGYIFSGHRGIGKTTIARILAQALNCRTPVGTPERPTPEPCGVCDSCTEIRAGNSVDVIEIDAATNRGIDEVRELREAARYRPARDKYKIWILDEAHQITDAAFNALLKTLEEPPEHVVFMMATTQPEDFPQTIRSRCQHFSFHAVKFDDILSQLRSIAAQEEVDAEDAALALLAEAGDGSMRDALSIMDQAIASAPLVDGRVHLEAAQIRDLMGSVPNAIFERLMEAISAGQTAPVIEEINTLLNAGNSPAALARQFVRYLRNALMARIGGQDSDLLQISADERARAGRSAMLFSEEDLTRFLQVMLRTFDDLNYRQEQRFHLELGLIKLVHLQRLLPVEELLSQQPPGAGSPGVAGGAGRTSVSAARPLPSTARTPVAPTQPPAKPAEAPRPSPLDSDRDRKKLGEPAGGPPAPRSLSPAEAVAKAAETSRSFLSPKPEAAAVTEVSGSFTVAAPAPDAAVPTLKAPASAISASGSAVAVEDAPAPGTPNPGSPLAVMGVAEPVLESKDALVLASNPSPVQNLDRIREAICAALDREGHNTAAELLHISMWNEQGNNIEVQVPKKKTMLALTINADAEVICRRALKSIGSSHKIAFVPGDPGAASGAPPRSVPSAIPGGVQAAALDNPMVKRTQELFKAEIRSVLDLREN